jgi:glycosyltransferase involved in cell wall biosynthesis
MNESEPRHITAVIPTWRRADFVVRAVRSALSQTYANIEAVVVVDGPDEETVQTLQALEEPRLRVIALAENVGGSEARNIGIRAARGSWIALLDDDDEWLPEKLTKQMAAQASLSTRQNCLITCRRIERRSGHADVIAPRRLRRKDEDVSEYMFYTEDGNKPICGPQTSGFLGTKELFLRVPFSKGLKCHQDWDWYLRAMDDSETVSFMVDEPLYIMNVEPARPRVTEIARWEISLDWVDSRKHLLTARAYTSFVINDCMYRCEERRNRLRVFQTLFARCWSNGEIRMMDLKAVVKWYIFRPSVRLRLIRYYKRMKQGLTGGAASHSGLDARPVKGEVWR